MDRFTDLFIWAGFLVAVACVMSFISWITHRRAKVESLAPAPVPVALRLVDDHRRRVAGTYVSAVRPSDGRMALSPEQKHAIAEGRKRKK
jgi:hypothetical protein